MRDLNRRVRHAMARAPSTAARALEAELLGFRAYFEFAAQHGALYRIIRQAEFVSPQTLHEHYEAIASGTSPRSSLRWTAARSRAMDPEVLAWALMGMGELLGMRWIVWEGAGEVPPELLDADADADRPGARRVTRVSLAATAAYLPERWMPAAEVAARAACRRRCSSRSSRCAASTSRRTTSTSATCRCARARRCSPRPASTRSRSTSSCTSARCGRTTPSGRRRRGSRIASARRTRYAVEYDNVSCGTPVALRLARDMLVAEPELRNVLLVGACRESYLLDYANERSRFMFNFGDGAAAGAARQGRRAERAARLARVTDGSLSLQVKVARGGSVHTNDGYPFLDVDDPAAMKEQLDESSLRNFVARRRGRARAFGARRSTTSRSSARCT